MMSSAAFSHPISVPQQRHAEPSQTLRKVLTNPLIIATVAGLLVKASRLTVPPPQNFATTFLAHLGNDSLAMGLLCIGAGLGSMTSGITSRSSRPPSSAACLRSPPSPGVPSRFAGLDPVEAGVAILFAALPTAQSCYVMTASMKGDAPSVANVTTAQTLAAMATLPFGSRRSSSASRPSRAETGIRERQMHERPQDRVSLRASHCSIRDEVRPTRGVARASEEACGGSILPSRRRPGARGTCGLRRA